MTFAKFRNDHEKSFNIVIHGTITCLTAASLSALNAQICVLDQFSNFYVCLAVLRIAPSWTQTSIVLWQHLRLFFLHYLSYLAPTLSSLFDFTRNDIRDMKVFFSCGRRKQQQAEIRKCLGKTAKHFKLLRYYITHEICMKKNRKERKEFDTNSLEEFHPDSLISRKKLLWVRRCLLYTNRSSSPKNSEKLSSFHHNLKHLSWFFLLQLLCNRVTLL